MLKHNNFILDGLTVLVQKQKMRLAGSKKCFCVMWNGSLVPFESAALEGEACAGAAKEKFMSLPLHGYCYFQIVSCDDSWCECVIFSPNVWVLN